MESDEDRPTLPADTLALLQEFYQEQADKASRESETDGTGATNRPGEMPEEDWVNIR